MPYLAVIIDCFSEAARSRVLWVLLAAWSILLIAIAPFSILQGVTTDFQSDSILARTQLIDALTAASNGKGSKSQKAVWELMEANLKQQIVDRNKNNRGGRLPMGELAKGISSVLDKPTLYSKEAWPTASKRSELESLLQSEPDKLSKESLQRLNRRLVELAFPGMLRSGDSNVIWIGYAGIKVSDPLPISKKQVQPFIEGFLLVTIMRIGLGIVGVFVGIVVTSALIPDMFQAGSLHLLLSKPVSRAGLLIAKFIGGTAFVAWNVAFILTGFFLLVGLRLELWNPGILLCIPVFVFIFMIFYSVSMLSGLIWKNAIISIAITALFWGFCTTIGITHDVMSGIVTQWPKIVSITSVGDQVFCVTARGRLQLWDPISNQWQTAYGETTGEETIIGPFWNESQQALFIGRPYRIPFSGGIQSDSIRMQIAKLPELSDSESAPENPETAQDNTQPKASGTPLWSDERIDTGPEFPPRTRRVIPWRDSLIALTERGLFQLDCKAAAKDDQKPSIEFLGFAIPIGKASESYQQITPSDWQPQSPMDITPSFDQERFFVYSHGVIAPLNSSDDGQFLPGVGLDMNMPDGSLALIAANQTTLVVATNKKGVFRIRIDEMNSSESIEGLESIVPRKVLVSTSDQSFLILDRDGKLWSLDGQAKQVTSPELPVSGRISAIDVDRSGNWWVAWGVNRISVWNPERNVVLREITPTFSFVESIFHRVVSPLYWINPKPAAVGATLRYCVTTEDPFSLGRETSELQESIVPPIDFWQPIWSNALFIAGILLVSCSLLYRQDL